MLTSAYTQRDGETIESIAFQILVERNGESFFHGGHNFVKLSLQI